MSKESTRVRSVSQSVSHSQGSLAPQHLPRVILTCRAPHVSQYARSAVPLRLQRMIIICSIVLMWMTVSPAFSVLGRPYEQIFVFSGMFTGEVVGYIFYRRLKAAHLRTRMQQSSKATNNALPSKREQVTEGVHAKQLHSFSLYFHDAALEHLYSLGHVGGWTDAQPASVHRLPASNQLSRQLSHPTFARLVRHALMTSQCPHA